MQQNVLKKIKSVAEFHGYDISENGIDAPTQLFRTTVQIALIIPSIGDWALRKRVEDDLVIWYDNLFKGLDILAKSESSLKNCQSQAATD